MKTYVSVFPLIFLLVLCFSLSFLFERKEAVITPFLPYKENFKNVLLKDETNDMIYDLSSNYELYNIEGNLMIGPYDGTNYEIPLKEARDRFDKLQKAKPVKCDNNFKCIADFGTNIGDDLCCGQTGVLQDTRYVCPSFKPTCSNFKCGSVFGTCS
jgi:hypothetical protein